MYRLYVPTYRYFVSLFVQLKMVVKKLKDQLEEKGKEVNQFREKHNIRIRGEGEGDSGPQKEESADNSSTQGILVA